MYGTVVSSILALVLAVPLAMGVATFTTEICPRRWRSFLSFMVELLAAIPSVIYGLWGIFVLAPLLRIQVEPWLLLISRNLERVADHATNIAEDVIFWVRGADVRHKVGVSAIGSE